MSAPAQVPGHVLKATFEARAKEKKALAAAFGESDTDVDSDDDDAEGRSGKTKGEGSVGPKQKKKKKKAEKMTRKSVAVSEPPTSAQQRAAMAKAFLIEPLPELQETMAIDFASVGGSRTLARMAAP